MLSGAQRSLSDVQPLKVAISGVLYHPEAIMFGFMPEGALDPIHAAVREATAATTGRTPTFTGPARRWTPHITISYSTGKQPMAPIAAALRHEITGCETTVGAVIQWGPNGSGTGSRSGRSVFALRKFWTTWPPAQESARTYRDSRWRSLAPRRAAGRGLCRCGPRSCGGTGRVRPRPRSGPGA